MRTLPAELFHALDEDGSGAVSIEEASAFYRKQGTMAEVGLRLIAVIL